jgi:predicted Zn-dependent protease
MRRLLLPVFSLALAAGCATNPATGRRELMLVSEAQEISLGREADPDIVGAYGLYPDSTWQQYVEHLGRRLAALSERPGLPWTFRVLDDPVVNAFALPGGFNYVTRGILAYFNSEAELVAVMGHELGHVTARHGARQMTQQQFAQAGLVASLVLVPRLQDFAGLAQAGLGLLFLKFSRDDERQADELGLRYLYRAGYDPREMPKVFAMLEQVSRASGGERLPGWLSTHPDPEDRQQHIAQLIAQLPQDFAGREVRHEEYLRRLDGLVFGANPREGFFRGSLFLHPDLAFQVRFPEGWATANQKRAVLAQSPAQDALLQLSVAEATSPAAGLRAFLAQPGVLAGPVSGRDINGLPAALAGFEARTADGSLAGVVAFVRHGSLTYRLLAYSVPGRWPSYEAAVLGAIQSFRPLADRTVLEVQPLRLAIVRVERAMSLGEFHRRYPSAVSLSELARLNQMGPDQALAPGQLLKRVVGGPLP